MADGMTRDEFSNLAYDLAMQSGPDADDLVRACDDLVAQAKADVNAEVERLRDALRLAESHGDAARRDLTAAYSILTDAMPGRPATVKAAAEKAVRILRDHDAERRRVLAERDEARAEVVKWRDLAVQAGESRAEEAVRATDAGAERDVALQRAEQAEAVLRELDVTDDQIHHILQRINARRRGAEQSRIQINGSTR